MNDTLAIALTMGEPSGVGAEISIKSWLKKRSTSVPSFFYIGDPELISIKAKDLGVEIPIYELDNIRNVGKYFNNYLPVLPIKLAKITSFGIPDTDNSEAIISSIEKAVELCLNNQAKAVVTNPINKAVLQNSGFTFPGHTEFLAHLSGIEIPVMLLSGEGGLRTVPTTIHLPLLKAIKMLNQDLIYKTVKVTYNSLVECFAIGSPKIALTGINPHAGEEGMLGDEEVKIIAPVLNRLINENIEVYGPFPADSIFSEDKRKGYDAIICMYHDQALIPIKALYFDSGVNCTLGLSFIRTSPDHGTALDIADKNVASPNSLIAALKLANEMADNKVNYSKRYANN